MTSIYDAAEASPPHASDHPDAVRGPWRAVRYTRDGCVIPTGDAPIVDYDKVVIDVVRDTQLPVADGIDSERMPDGPYRPIDLLYRHQYVEDEAEFAARWAQARMVAALLNHNQAKLDALAETKE